MSELLVGSFSERVRPLLDACDAVRELTLAKDGGADPFALNLPSIAVVGDQSSGKSSIVESLSGIALPRGQNIVTRCPLVLRLVGDSKQAPRAVLRSRRSEEVQVRDLRDVGRHVESLTNLLAGGDYGISTEPIQLTVYKAGAPDMTLIDLPGITRNPVGNQPENIGELVRSLIRSYVQNPNCVILCVLPATIDFATSEAIALARGVDPQGLRTLGVVTKIDQAEKGIAMRLQGKGRNTVNLRLGFVGVRCRTQLEIEQGLSTAQALQREQELFVQNEELRSLPSGCKGTPELARHLCELQHAHLELRTLSVRCDTEEAAAQEYAKLLWRFCQDVNDMREGDPRRQGEAPQQEAHLHARMYDLFVAYNANARKAVCPFFTEEYVKRVAAEVHNARGTVLPSFTHQPVFERLVNEETKKLRSPSLVLVRDVRRVVEEELLARCLRVFQAHSDLAHALKAKVQEMLEAVEETALSRINDLLDQADDVYVCSAPFGSLVTQLRTLQENPNDKLKAVLHRIRGIPLSELDGLMKYHEEENVLVQINLCAYFTLLVDRLGDEVPLTLRLHFLHKMTERLPFQLQQAFSSEEVFKLMQEKSDRRARREQCEANIVRLEKAFETLRRVL